MRWAENSCIRHHPPEETAALRHLSRKKRREKSHTYQYMGKARGKGWEGEEGEKEKKKIGKKMRREEPEWPVWEVPQEQFDGGCFAPLGFKVVSRGSGPIAGALVNPPRPVTFFQNWQKSHNSKRCPQIWSWMMLRNKTSTMTQHTCPVRMKRYCVVPPSPESLLAVDRDDMWASSINNNLANVGL